MLLTLSLREVAQRFPGYTVSGLHRHRKAHLLTELAHAEERRKAKVERDADDLLGQVNELKRRAISILDRAEEAGSLVVALSAIRECRETIRLLAQLSNQLHDTAAITVNLWQSADWLAFQRELLHRLADHPEARRIILEALDWSLGSAGGPQAMPTSTPALVSPGAEYRTEID